MTNKLLLPNRFKMIGWCILIPATIAGIILTITGYEADWLSSSVFAFFSDEAFGDSQFFTMITVNITNTLIGSIFIVGAILVSFSKEKKEDEFIANLRLSSLLWSVWVNYALLLIAFLFVYGLAFFNVMVYNMFTILIIFIIRFNYILYKNSKSMSDEK
ncbi:MAG: hypothetical protein IPP15_18915 [Saprospiraceae bacterium]|uniref:Uncharacterized protein n=1 Tax=Candidatus Opimibacter skivensis TaxID=2982028 RepID=A0A9D7T144_9BACT|nr:hypothetical protein [Candidatus Opimibacter skivensis]